MGQAALTKIPIFLPIATVEGGSFKGNKTSYQVKGSSFADVLRASSGKRTDLKATTPTKLKATSQAELKATAQTELKATSQAELKATAQTE
ncbi:MAG: hypothetical protein C4527_16200, partial [Candidatus Omnitrophota bacterium]